MQAELRVLTFHCPTLPACLLSPAQSPKPNKTWPKLLQLSKSPLRMTIQLHNQCPARGRLARMQLACATSPKVVSRWGGVGSPWCPPSLSHHRPLQGCSLTYCQIMQMAQVRWQCGDSGVECRPPARPSCPPISRTLMVAPSH